jgi:hypothetical protein
MQSHRHFAQRWSAVAMIFAILLLVGLCRVAEAQANSTLPELLARANALTDLATALPYELHAQIVIEPGSKHAQRGEITIYRDHARARTELQLGDFHQVEVIREGTRYVSRSRLYPLAGLDVLTGLEDVVYLRNEFPHVKFKRHFRKVGGVPASCFDVRVLYSKIEFCFDENTGAVLEASDDSGWHGRFSGYTAVGEKSFPTKIELTQPGKPRHVELSEIQVIRRRFDEASFAVPQDARAFTICNGITRAEGAGLDSDWGISRTGVGEIYVYAIVERDGSAHDLAVYGGSKWMEKQVSKAARKWNFYPAHCGRTMIASEVVLPVVHMEPGLDPRTNSSSDSSTTPNSVDIFRPYTYNSDSTDINTYRNPP